VTIISKQSVMVQSELHQSPETNQCQASNCDRYEYRIHIRDKGNPKVSTITGCFSVQPGKEPLDIIDNIIKNFSKVHNINRPQLVALDIVIKT